MKVTLYDIKGLKKEEIKLPELFNSKIREDIVQKYYETQRRMIAQQYSNYSEAGKRHSAAGTISHKRHDWKGHYGKGMSRAPRKTMWRRGTQFYWIGAEVSGARGGRRAHPPKIINRMRKINKKEIKMAYHSAIAATADKSYVLKRYSSLDKLDMKLPIVIESINKIKTKDFISILKNLLGEAFRISLKKKTVRAGKGKFRGRRYKSNAGILVIKSKNEDVKIKGIGVRSVNEISIWDLYPLGRLTIYTKKALEELK